MDHAWPAPMEQYPDLEELLCTACALPFYQCLHAMPQAPYVAAQMLYEQPQQFTLPVADPYPTEADLQPIFQFVRAESHPDPLVDELVQHINEDETTVQPATVQAHIEDIYTPGDRVVRRPRSRKSPQRRQAPRPGGGYSCRVDGCERSFDRACELNRHHKTHLDRSERPHKCSVCGEGFLYPKDLLRHERKHIDQPAEQITFFCNFPDCRNHDGFSRRDNLLRHQRKQHTSLVATN